MKIVIIGGSGLIGSKLVVRLREDGHEVVSASLDSGVNTVTGDGLAEALRGASVVVDVSNSPSYEEAAVLEFFETSTRNLLDAEAAAGTGHHVALSIVGTDRLPDSGYYRAKLAQEKLITTPRSRTRSSTPLSSSSSSGRSLTPPLPATPSACRRCSSSPWPPTTSPARWPGLVGAPLNGIVEIGGPERFRLDELIRRVLNSRHDPRRVLTDPHALYFGGRLDEHTLVPGDNARLATTRFEDWLNQPGNA